MTTLRAVVDRIEGEMAVVLIGDESHRVVIPRHLLPEDAGEGSVLKLQIEVDQTSTSEAKHRVQDIIDRLSGEGNRD